MLGGVINFLRVGGEVFWYSGGWGNPTLPPPWQLCQNGMARYHITSSNLSGSSWNCFSRKEPSSAAPPINTGTWNNRVGNNLCQAELLYSFTLLNVPSLTAFPTPPSCMIASPSSAWAASSTGFQGLGDHDNFSNMDEADRSFSTGFFCREKIPCN